MCVRLTHLIIIFFNRRRKVIISDYIKNVNVVIPKDYENILYIIIIIKIKKILVFIIFLPVIIKCEKNTHSICQIRTYKGLCHLIIILCKLQCRHVFKYKTYMDNTRAASEHVI